MKRLLLTLFTVSLFAATSFADSGGPDAYGYVWRDNLEVNGPVYNWIDITNRQGVNVVENMGDDNTFGVPINFTFHYYWYDVDQYFIGSNGYLMFQTMGQISASFPTIPNTLMPQNYIAPMACDLNFDGVGNTGQCLYWTSANHDSLIVSWINVPFWDQNTTYQGSNTFQLILATADSSITFQYANQSGIYTGNALNYISAGIENVSGAIGLQSMLNPLNQGTYYVTTPYAVKFYYPSNSTYQVSDAATLNNNNPTNGGRFISNNTPAPYVLTASVQNTGNTNVNSFNVTSRIINSVNNTVVMDSMQSGALNAGQSVDLTFGNTFSPTLPGTFVQRTHAFLPGDIVSTNDSLPMEIVVVDTTSMPLRLTFDDGIADGVGISWAGGTGGCAMEFTPPFYPCKITMVHFYIQANPNGFGFYATVMDDNGNGGSPGIRLDSVYVDPVNIAAPGWVDVPLTAPIQINDGKFYVVWNMDGADLSLGQDLTVPISNNTYEILGNTYAIYRSRELEDLMINATIDTVFTTVGINESSVSENVFEQFYPNPASKYVVMNFHLPEGQNKLSYELYSSEGRLVHSETLEQGSKKSNKLVIDINDLPSGIYLCKLTTGKVTAQRKIVISH